MKSMSYRPIAPRERSLHSALCHGLSWVKDCLRLTFISGPKVLFTSQISAKCAASMILMCAPALLFCVILTLPAMIFQSPQQNAYYHFARVLEEDPARWIALLLTGLCAILSLALPAIMAPPRVTDLF